MSGQLIVAIVTTLIYELALIAVVLWGLPRLGIYIPMPGLVVLVLAWAAWSYLTYWLGKGAIGKTPAVGPEAMVGIICRTTTPLCPLGYVQAGIELWRAYSISGDVDAGVEVVTVGMKGLTLFVTGLHLENGTTRCRPDKDNSYPYQVQEVKSALVKCILPVIY